MSQSIRVATFNLENLDDRANVKPPLETRISLMKPQLLRLRADILCLQEVNTMSALEALLQDTPYTSYQHRFNSTDQATGQPLHDRNLVILSRFEITNSGQYLHNLVPTPFYKMVTADPPVPEAQPVRWERPILNAKIKLEEGLELDLIVVHLKSKLPTDIPGQQDNRNFSWKTISGWAEGFFLSSMKRVGQALEVRFLIEQILEHNHLARIIVCGDFNSDLADVPLQAIRGDVENTNNGSLTERIMVPCERTVPEPARFSLLYQGKGEMIDHLLISRGLLPFYRHTEIHNEILHDESIAFRDDVKYPESDHAPVVAEFEF